MSAKKKKIINKQEKNEGKVQVNRERCPEGSGEKRNIFGSDKERVMMY